MATCNQHTDIEQVPANNRTGNPEYHKRLEAERGTAPAGHTNDGHTEEKPAEEHH
jgi:hypothetical protein